jgi:hypothetical protein
MTIESNITTAVSPLFTPSESGIAPLEGTFFSP